MLLAKVFKSNAPAPPQAMQYMELIPESQRPVSGTVGALERRRQLFSQLPVYDQDPMKCQSLASEEEVGNNMGIMLTLAWLAH